MSPHLPRSRQQVSIRPPSSARSRFGSLLLPHRSPYPSARDTRLPVVVAARVPRRGQLQQCTLSALSLPLPKPQRRPSLSFLISAGGNRDNVTHILRAFDSNN